MVAANTFPITGTESLDSAIKAFAITPDDSNELSFVTRGIHVGVSGNIVVVFEGDSSSVTLAVNGGTCYPYRIKKVLSSLTTATGLVGLY